MFDSGDKSSDARTKEFLHLLGVCEPSLRGYVLALAPNWTDAEEIMQETRIRLWEQFDEYDRDKDFATWARTIARFQALTARKRAQRAAQPLSEHTVELVAETAEHMAGEADARRWALENCLARLTDEHRELIQHCYSGDQTIKRVAEDFGRSVRGTQQTVARIRALLQECIEREVRREESS